MVANIERLRSIKSFAELVAYLRDELDWEFETEDVEDLAYEYSPAELGLDTKSAAAIREIKQFRPLVDKQPWGIFYLDFAGQKLSVAALRGILRGLVAKKRASANQSEMRKWEVENLIFICTSDKFENFNFAYFRGEQTARAVLSTFGWHHGDTHLRTLAEYNLPALRFPSDVRNPDEWLKKWRAAFDVEIVTDKFFTDYRKVFESVEKEVKASIKNSETARLYTQRLFNRLMFLYFIQKKGWLSFNGQTAYLRALFEASEAGNENFLRDRLYWLFFWGLSNVGQSREVHEHDFLIERRGHVPYLNGGLFDIEDDYDSDRDNVKISNEAFGKIFNLFERYNFTVEESTPLDVQVAVDPEMLGKVFEELVTGRHETGSYYTPRPIVSFMCREALKYYLADVQSSEDAISSFVDEGDAGDLENPEAVLEALKRVRVCDPACGSGAYLLGMMHELTRLRAALFKSKKIDDATLYDRKRWIIENNLYGVDNDRFAVQIACLRLWLTLAIESDNPHPLPNLDFKIEYGDSLIAPAPSEAHEQMTFGRTALVNDFRRAKGEYMRENDAERKWKLRQEIENLRKEIALLLKHRMPRLSEGQIQKKREELLLLEKDIERARNPTIKAQLRKQADELNRVIAEHEKTSEDEVTGFDWAVEFAEVFMPAAPERWRMDDLHPTLNDFKQQGTLIEEADVALSPGGFDVVLANPPYVSFGLRGNKAAKAQWASVMRNLYPNSAEYKISLYAIFIDRGLQLCRPGGTLVYITPDSFLLGRYFSKLRSRILEECHIDLICMFEADFWKSGVVGRPTILKVSNEKNERPTRVQLFSNLEALEGQQGFTHTYSQKKFETVPHKRFRLFFSTRAMAFVERLEEASVPLGSLARITTGVRSKIGQERIVGTEPLTPKWKRGITSGGQVKPYRVDYQGHYLHINGELLWAGGWNAQTEENPKLLIRQTGDSLIAAIDREGFYHLNNVHSLSITDNRISLEYICALLNSRLMNRYYHLISLERRRAMAQTDIETLETLPIRIPTAAAHDKVRNLVKSIFDGDESALGLVEAVLASIYAVDEETKVYLQTDDFY